MERVVTDPATFYGPIYAMANEGRKERLNKALKFFDMAINAHVPGVADRALIQATKAEDEAFAIAA